MLPNIGFFEIIVIAAFVLILFGPRKLPEIARGLGRSVQAFKRGLKEPDAGEDPKNS